MLHLSDGALERLNALSDQLDALEKPLHLSDYNAPINMSEQRERFASAFARGEAYNPQFIYATPPEGWERPLQAFLRTLEPERSVWDTLIFEDVLVTLQCAQAITVHDPALITAYTLRGFGVVARTLVEAALETLRTVPAPESSTEPTLTAEQAAEVMRTALDRVQLKDWEVIVKQPMLARMAVRGVEQQVNIRKDAVFTEDAVRRLLVHEIGTHVFRYKNGSLQRLRLARRGFAPYGIAEEGMAAYNEARFGLLGANTMRRHAYAVIAAHLCLNNSFYEVAAALVDHGLTPVDAFSIVARAKRGFTDTREYGAHVKDKVYFEGYRQVRLHLAEHPDDYDLLMSGKFTVELLPAARELRQAGLLTPALYLPEMLFETA